MHGWVRKEGGRVERIRWGKGGSIWGTGRGKKMEDETWDCRSGETALTYGVRRLYQPWCYAHTLYGSIMPFCNLDLSTITRIGQLQPYRRYSEQLPCHFGVSRSSGGLLFLYMARDRSVDDGLQSTMGPHRGSKVLSYRPTLPTFLRICALLYCANNYRLRPM